MKKTAGFTLLEFLIVIFIVMITVSISVHLFLALNKDYGVLSIYLTSLIKGREAIDAISRDCRIAIRIMDAYGGYVTTDECLVLKVPSIDASRNIIDINKEFDYIIYRIETGDLWKTVIPGLNSARPAANSVLKKDVEYVYFAYNGTGISNIAHKSSIAHLTIWVSISETLIGKNYGVTPGTTVKLMNYEWEFVR